MDNNDVVLEVTELTKRFGEFTAVDKLSLQLERGRILGFIGHNGAGKTTAIRILVGLLRPTSGSARIAGADCVEDARRIKQLVGYMPDRFGSYDNMRVHEYLDFFGAAFGISRRTRVERIEAVLDMTGSAYMRDRYVESLSHGMKQKIGIARTLLHDPEVLILDEPANGLDPEARIEMRQVLLNLASLGKTLIVTSHILPELSRICDRVAIIHQGCLRAFGSLEEVTRQFRQKRLIEVQLVSSDELGRAEEVVKSSDDEASDISQSSAEAILRFRTGESEDSLGHLLQALVKADVRVSQFREVAGDLEDAFLSVTREES